MWRSLPDIAVASSLISTFALSLSPFIPTFQNSTSLGALSPNLPRSGNIACSGRFYGYGLNPESCENAWEKIRQTTAIHYYHNRPSSGSVKPPDIALPVRYLSDDGICAIDIKSPKVGKSGDSTNGLQIAENAELLLNRCVKLQRRGGSIASFSMSTLYLRLLRGCKGL